MLTKLAEGGMGTVCLCADCVTGQKLVMKMVSEEKHWRREKQVLEKMMQYSGIPNILKSGKELGYWILVMEYIQGTSIRQWMMQKGIPGERQFFLWMLRICEIVGNVHACGMVHMDLKPENVLIKPQGEIFLIDFGISAQIGEEIEAYGTKDFSAPEQRKKGVSADVRMDIYSLGKMMQFCGGKACSGRVREMIKRCTGKDAGERYGSVRELINDLRKRFFWMELEKTGRMVGILAAASCVFYKGEQSRHLERGVEVAEKKAVKNQWENRVLRKKGTSYLFGENGEPADYDLACQYFSMIRKPDEKESAYLRILQGIRRQNIAEGEQMWKDLLYCEQDAKSIGAMRFFMGQYIFWADRMPDEKESWRRAWELLCKMEKTAKDEKQRRLWQQERLELYEYRAKQGEAQEFLQETSRPLHETMDALEAWQLYRRKILYFDEKHQKVDRYYEEFLKKYSNVPECYLEYVIYLCREKRWEKAKVVFQEGRQNTKLMGEQAEGLRRKLGL